MEVLKMRILIDAKYIKQQLKRFDYTFSELEEITGINKNRWMYILKRGGYVKDTELGKIADAIQCDQNEFIHPEFRIKQNTPLELDILVRNLYGCRKGDIQPLYDTIMKNFQKTGKLDMFIGQANRLYDVLFSPDQFDVNLEPALTIIVDDFKNDRIMSGSHAELSELEISNIFRIVQDSFHYNSAQQALAIFLYVLVLFDVVFLEESIASITQFETERFGDKADQYCKLTCSLEILRNTLLRYMISKDLKINNIMVDKLTDEIIDGVHLMLLACYRAGQHINGDYISSEYVNRKELDAIITNLTRRMRNIGLNVPDTPLGLPGTRFGNYLFFLRSIFMSSKQGKWSFSFPEALCMGYMMGYNNAQHEQ